MEEEIKKPEPKSDSFEISESLKNLILKKVEETEEKYESYINNLYKIRDCDCGNEGRAIETRMLSEYNFFSKLLKEILVNGVLIKKPEEQNNIICLGSVFTATLVKLGKKEINDKDETFILDGCNLSRKGDRPRIISYKTLLGVSFLGGKKGKTIKVKNSDGRISEYVIKEIFFPW